MRAVSLHSPPKRQSSSLWSSSYVFPPLPPSPSSSSFFIPLHFSYALSVFPLLFFRRFSWPESLAPYFLLTLSSSAFFFIFFSLLSSFATFFLFCLYSFSLMTSAFWYFLSTFSLSLVFFSCLLYSLPRENSDVLLFFYFIALPSPLPHACGPLPSYRHTSLDRAIHRYSPGVR